EKVLPGANCSGCGNPSCYAYARAMVESGAAPNLCVLAADKAEEIGSILGKEVSMLESQVAAIRCYGGTQTAKQFEYNGIPSCRAAAFFSGGDNACQYSCLGFGDCISACPFGALTRDGRSRPVVDRKACTGCGRCMSECPKGVIVLMPAAALPLVACSTRDKGKIVRQNCKIGCIGCGKCVKVCAQDAVSIQDNLVLIDYDKCNGCGTCVESCSRNIIVDYLGAGAPEALSK
ncbi:RnfABCDGE type electron transport complex subunit B, partial [Thermodesulfobacteriota bacterium]